MPLRRARSRRRGRPARRQRPAAQWLPRLTGQPRRARRGRARHARCAGCRRLHPARSPPLQSRLPPSRSASDATSNLTAPHHRPAVHTRRLGRCRGSAANAQPAVALIAVRLVQVVQMALTCSQHSRAQPGGQAAWRRGATPIQPALNRSTGAGLTVQTTGWAARRSDQIDQAVSTAPTSAAFKFQCCIRSASIAATATGRLK